MVEVERHPRLIKLLIITQLFVAISSIGGGIALMFGAMSNASRLLEYTAFSSYVIPGLVLGLVVGGTQLVAVAAMLNKNYRQGLLYSAIAGFGLLIWIYCQVYMIEGRSTLQTLFASLGILQLVLVFLLLGIRGGKAKRQ